MGRGLRLIDQVRDHNVVQARYSSQRLVSPARLAAATPATMTERIQRIHSAQQRAARSVNRELVLLYWQIGSDILARQGHEGWRAKVIDRLSVDLRNAFPEMKGFSPRNLKYMRAFAQAWSDAAFVKEVLAQLPR